jgi:ABC-type uncharacterized transport system involved in gliding motility auxiliary subunit
VTSSLLAALGLVGLVFAVLHFLLGLFGAGFDPLWVGANLVAGVVLLALAAALNLDALRERMSSGEARRAGKYGTSAILSTGLVLVILGLLAFLSTRYHWRFDWSEAKVHSLSDQSRKLLTGLDRDVEVVAFYAPLDMQPARDLLDRYAYESARFKVQYVDPNEHPELLARYEIAPEKLGNGLVRIALGDESVEVDEVTEENVTNAMVKLARTGEKKVYFLEGHGERAAEGEAGGRKEGYERAADALRNENYRVEKLLLAAKGEVPPDADVLVIPGPTRPLLPAEREALRRYLERGGAVFVLVDPRAQTDLVEDVRAWGVNLGEDIVVDRELALFGRATTPFAGRYAESHEITKDLRDTTLFNAARSVRSAGDGKASLTEIVFTGNASWAETDLQRFFGEGTAELGESDLRGPVSIAVAGTLRLAGGGAAAEAKAGEAKPGEAPAGDAQAKAPSGEAAEAEASSGAGAEPEGASGEGAQAEGASGEEAKAAAKETGPEARIAVFGDSDFASNELVEAYRNRDLFVNTVNWLMGDVEAISIRPARSRASRFQLTQEQFLGIRSLSLFVLPEAIAIVGVLVWWSRRRAPER